MVVISVLTFLKQWVSGKNTFHPRATFNKTRKIKHRTSLDRQTETPKFGEKDKNRQMKHMDRLMNHEYREDVHHFSAGLWFGKTLAHKQKM